MADPLVQGDARKHDIFAGVFLRAAFAENSRKFPGAILAREKRLEIGFPGSYSRVNLYLKVVEQVLLFEGVRAYSGGADSGKESA